MAALPAPQVFTAGENSIPNLQALSQAVSFLADGDLTPVWTLYRTANQSITSGTVTTVTFNQVANDSDGVSDGTGALIVTQGYYRVEACGMSLNTQANSEQVKTWFLWTAGGNNPNFSSGTTKTFGGRTLQSVDVTGTDTAMSCRAWCPYVCYPGDKLYVQVYSATVTVNLNSNVNTNFLEGRFAPRFTGTWVATGS